MAQVFIYTEDAQIPKAHLTALRKAGIVPVRVSSFDEAKFIDPVTPIPNDDFLRIAIETINVKGWDSTKSYFVAQLAKLISDRATPGDRQ